MEALGWETSALSDRPDELGIIQPDLSEMAGPRLIQHGGRIEIV